MLPKFSSRSQLVAFLFDTLHATRLSATMPQQPLHLAHELLTLFSKGEVSASTVQSLAHSARCDGWGKHNKLASQLASASTQGKHSGNVNRDIIRAARAAGLLSSSAQPYIIELPDHTTLDIFLPHEAYYKMVEVDGLESFCLAETDTSQPELAALITEWMGHREVDIRDPVSTVAALGLHCDGVPYTHSVRPGGSKSVFACSMNVISSASDKTRANRQPIFCLQKERVCKCCSGFHTLDFIFQVITWSLECLAKGVSPTRRHDDTEFTPVDRKNRIPGGVPLSRAGLMQVRGDWEFFEHAFKFRSVNSNYFCWKCDATKEKGQNWAYNFSADAGHRATGITHRRYLASCLREGSTPSSLFAAPGFDIKYVAADSMHCGDLGVFQDAIGSLLWIEVQNKQWHKSAPKGLAKVNAMLKSYHQASDKSRNKLQLTMSQIKAKKDPPFPCLKAKAAETRHLAEFANTLAHMHAGELNRARLKFHRNHPLAGKEDNHLTYLVQMTEGMVDYHNSCAASPFSASDCRTAMYSFLDAFKGLHDLWDSAMMTKKQRARCPFHVRPKTHMLMHVVDEQLGLFGSPNRCWCYRDEDFVGAVKTIASRSSHPTTLESRVCEKLTLLAGLGGRV